MNEDQQPTASIVGNGRSRTGHQTDIAALGTRALAGAGIDELFNSALQLLAEALQIDYGMVLEVTQAADQLALRAGLGWQEPAAVRFAIDGAQSGGAALLSHGAVFIDDLQAGGPLSQVDLLQQHGVRSALCVKLYGLSQPYGVIGVFKRQPAAFTADDLYLLQGIANLLATAIHRNQGHEHLKKLTEQLESEVVARTRLVQLLQDVTIAANQAETIPEAMQTALNLICDYTGWQLGHVFYRSGVSGDELLPTQIWCVKQPDSFEAFRRETAELRLSPGVGLPGKVLESGELVLRRNVPAHEHTRRQAARNCGIQDGLAFPVMAGKEVAAVMEFFTTHPMGINLSLIEAMANIGTQLGRVVERRQAEDQIRQSQRRLAEAQHIARLGSWEWTLATQQFVCSEELYTICGLDPAGPALTFEDFQSCIHPADQETLLHAVQQARHERQGFEIVHRILRPDGEERILRTNGQVISSAGKPVKLLGTGQDITEQVHAEEKLRASEARFRTIFEGSAVGKAIIDLQHKILVTNSAMQNMLGYSTAELEGMELADLILPLDYFNNHAVYEEFFANGKNILQLEQRLRHRDHRIVWGSFTFSWMRKENGAPWFAIVMVEDITTRKQVEAELAEVNKQLVVSRERERLRLAQELHDEPLQELYGLMFQLSDFSKFMPAGEAAQELQAAQKTVTNLINSLRGICRELRPPALAPFGLEGAIRELAERYREEHPEVNLELDLMYDGQILPEHVRLTLFRILQQSLTNITRHAQARSIAIRFRFDSSEIVFEIEDDGRGFPVPKRWVSLVRQGHLGLAGAAERVETIDGQFHVISAPGEGTLIQVVVPRSGAAEVLQSSPLNANGGSQ
ncbi:MAG: PAS domain S-box protein [Chloroflexota bacterium]